MLKATFEDLYTLRCLQTGNEDGDITLQEAEEKFGHRFVMILQATNHDPCNGCPDYDGGKCLAYRAYHTKASDIRKREEERAFRARNSRKAPGTDKYPLMSVKQIAAKLGISKSEVRRRKLAGEL